MRALNETAWKLVVPALLVMLAQACASTPSSDSTRASRNEAGQSALEGMENSVLKDNDPNSPVLRSKPAN